MPFEVGQPVRARIMNPDGHTRLPAYLRGRQGRIECIAGVFDVSDARAKGVRNVREPVYTVLFDARDVWGADADPRQTLTADLYERYLESA